MGTAGELQYGISALQNRALSPFAYSAIGDGYLHFFVFLAGLVTTVFSFAWLLPRSWISLRLLILRSLIDAKNPSFANCRSIIVSDSQFGFVKSAPSSFLILIFSHTRAVLSVALEYKRLFSRLSPSQSRFFASIFLDTTSFFCEK